MNEIKLRRTEKSDLDTLFTFQLDEEANRLAAFTSKLPADKQAYLDKYTPFLSDPSIFMQTIWSGDTIIGSIAKYEIEHDAEITYWIDKTQWGKGVATIALKLFLAMENTRPIYGRTAFDNLGSQKVLEKCGFVKIGTDKGYANARAAEIEEYIYILSA